jgi:hypothetical protein
LYQQDLKQKENIVALLELLQLYRKEFQQLQEDEDDPNRQESAAFPVPEAYQNLPLPVAVQSKFFRNHDAAARDETKRGSCKYRKTYTTVVMPCNLVERYQCLGGTCCPVSSG